MLSVLERFVALATVLVLAAALPLALVAVRGFADAPFRRLLRPIPVVFAAYIALNVPLILSVETSVLYDAVVSSVAVGAALLAALEAAALLGGWRAL